ncbi:hypothetical protein HN014_07980 [Aquimarina sp. TRL1]|uniref:hypothetical protein n=1 Tax=Aquimarina sp. (strain TRL1) TaxID=2736252 RepID=UPI001589B27B|nr:hypothetical protein [Aquimarina sp. TRL1]QKX04856.1 hypothetical protein HN014_07980 [Aquimarina sp. TRL1]
MPHLWKNKIWVATKEELVPACYRTYSNLSNELWRYKDKNYGIKRVQSGGNGRQLLVDFDSLSKKHQEILGDPRKIGHLLEQYYKVSKSTIDFYYDFQYDDGRYLLPETKDKYVINASVLYALLELKKDRTAERLSKGASIRGIDKSLLLEAKSYNELLQKQQKPTHNLPLSQRFYKTLRDFEEFGLISLVKDAKGSRKSNALKMTPETISLLNAMFAKQKSKPTPTKVAKQYEAFLSGYVKIVNTDTGLIFDPKEFKALSLSAITSYLSSWDSQIGTHAIRNGNRQKLNQKLIPYHSLQQAKYANSLLSIDDRQPPFEYQKGKRMWFYNAIDTGSEAFTCWVWGKSKEGIIIDFYRQLVRNYHEWNIPLPDGLECESSLNASFKDTFLKDGAMFQNVRIEANNARGKRIEAYFKPLRYELEKEREGWLARPFAQSEPNQISNEKKQIIPYDRLVEECLIDIVTWNNMEHSKIKGKTRWEVFLETQNPNVSATNYKEILPYLGYSSKTSCNAGIVKLQRTEWLLGDKGRICTGDSLIRLMKEIEAKNFDVYYLDDNSGNIFKAFVYVKGRYICEILPKPSYPRAIIERSPSDELARDLMSKYVATVQGYMRSQKNSIDNIVVIDNTPKTLNNKFQIASIGKYVPKQEPAKEVPIYDEELPLPRRGNNNNNWNSNMIV